MSWNTWKVSTISNAKNIFSCDANIGIFHVWADRNTKGLTYFF